jgi:hypothetical protein
MHLTSTTGVWGAPFISANSLYELGYQQTLGFSLLVYSRKLGYKIRMVSFGMLGRVALVRFLQEPHAVTSQKTPFFIVTAVKTSNLLGFYPTTSDDHFLCFLPYSSSRCII